MWLNKKFSIYVLKFYAIFDLEITHKTRKPFLREVEIWTDISYLDISKSMPWLVTEPRKSQMAGSHTITVVETK